MGVSQFGRMLGVAFALAALACAVFWLSTGATPPPNLATLENVADAGHYLSLDYSGTDDQAAKVLKELEEEGYPAVDSYAGTHQAGEHNFVILKSFTQQEAMAAAARVNREFSTGAVSIGSLQEQLFLGDMLKGRYPFGQLFVFGMSQAEQPAARALLFVITASVMAAAILALLLLVRGSPSAATRWLGTGLGCWSLGVAYLWLFSVVPAFAAYQPASLAVRVSLDALAFLLLFTASLAYIRFWKGYPQPISDDELDGFLDALKHDQLARASTAARMWFRRGRRSADGPAARDDRVPGNMVADPAGRVRNLKLALITMAVLLAGLAWTGGFTLPEALAVPAIPFAFLVFVLLTYWPGLTCLRVFKYHRSTGSAEDCRKIEWIWASIWLGFVAIVLPCIILAVLYVGRYFVPELEGYEHLADTLFIFGLTSGPLLVILALSVSILYHGSIDPRLALRGITLWSVLGIFLTLVFVLVERSIAVRLARWWGLAPQTGYVTAGAMVAATFQPLRKYTEKNVTRFVERVMPAAVLSSGTRLTLAVAVVDITGYTALSAKDEQSALIASALVQKEARRIADGAGGRVVKSTGDGVIMAFADPGKAIDAVIDLHRSVRASAAALSLPAIDLHTGLHWGEVVEMRDGDIYGMTVNLASRLADWAKAGEVGVSRTFHARLEGDARGFEDQGPQSFKNVPEPISCLKLKDA